MKEYFLDKMKFNISSKITIFAVILIALFLITPTKSFAVTNNINNLFGLTKVDNIFTPDRIGHIDMSAKDEVEVCKDPTCTNPKPGIIYFKISKGSPLVIDSDNGLRGQVFGNELGIIKFKSSYGRVYIANKKTGLLKGVALAGNSGTINFSVTGQQVIIDPKTGEWKGWAWASGPYGGWIKFDCAQDSCVKTVWNNKKVITPNPQVAPKKNVEVNTASTDKIEVAKRSFNITINNISSWLTNFINKTEKVTKQGSQATVHYWNSFTSNSGKFFSRNWNSLTSNSKNFFSQTWNSLASSESFFSRNWNSLTSNSKNFFSQTGKVISSTYNLLLSFSRTLLKK